MNINYFEEGVHQVNVGRIKSFGVMIESSNKNAQELLEMIKLTEYLSFSDISNYVKEVFYDSSHSLCTIFTKPTVRENDFVFDRIKDAAKFVVSRFVIHNPKVFSSPVFLRDNDKNIIHKKHPLFSEDEEAPIDTAIIGKKCEQDKLVIADYAKVINVSEFCNKTFGMLVQYPAVCRYLTKDFFDNVSLQSVNGSKVPLINEICEFVKSTEGCTTLDILRFFEDHEYASFVKMLSNVDLGLAKPPYSEMYLYNKLDEFLERLKDEMTKAIDSKKIGLEVPITESQDAVLIKIREILNSQKGIARPINGHLKIITFSKNQFILGIDKLYKAMVTKKVTKNLTNQLRKHLNNNSLNVKIKFN